MRVLLAACLVAAVAASSLRVKHHHSKMSMESEVAIARLAAKYDCELKKGDMVGTLENILGTNADKEVGLHFKCAGERKEVGEVHDAAVQNADSRFAAAKTKAATIRARVVKKLKSDMLVRDEVAKSELAEAQSGAATATKQCAAAAIMLESSKGVRAACARMRVPAMISTLGSHPCSCNLP